MIILRKSKYFAAPSNNGGGAANDNKNANANKANANNKTPEQKQQPNPNAPKPTSKDLTIETIRLQRALVQAQKQRMEVKIQENKERSRIVRDAQRNEQRKDEMMSKNEIRRRKIEADTDSAKNVNLYKSSSHPVAPVPMKH